MEKNIALVMLLIVILILVCVLFNKNLETCLLVASMIANVLIIYYHFLNTVPNPSKIIDNIFNDSTTKENDNKISDLRESHYVIEEPESYPNEAKEVEEEEEVSLTSMDILPHRQYSGGISNREMRINWALDEHEKVKTFDERLNDFALLRDRARQNIVGQSAKDVNYYKYHHGDEGDIEETKYWWENDF